MKAYVSVLVIVDLQTDNGDSMVLQNIGVYLEVCVALTTQATIINTSSP
jgi:hypothetical protein